MGPRMFNKNSKMKYLVSGIGLGVALGVGGAVLAWSPVVHAQGEQGKTEPAPVRSSKVVAGVGEEVVTLAKPDGWVVGQAPKGSLALMRAAGDKSSQLEVRYTQGIAPDQKKQHFSSFHTSLKQMGLEKIADSKIKKAGVFEAVVQTEYKLLSGGKTFRLVVMHVHRGDAAWFFTGFFPEDARDEHYKSLVSLIETASFSK